MKKLIVAAVAAIVFIANIQAQNKKWSLKECIDYAILHNIEVKQSQNRIKSLKVERNTLKSSFLPEILIFQEFDALFHSLPKAQSEYFLS